MCLSSKKYTGEETLAKLKSEDEQKKLLADSVLPAYRQFRSWAEEFEEASMYVYQFVDEHPDFFSVFNGSFSVSKYGINFHYKDTYPDFSYPDNCYYDWKISDPKWPSINYWNAFPNDLHIMESAWKVYPDVITYTDIGWSHCILVYSRSGRLPSAFIRDKRNENRYFWNVNIRKH